MSHHVPPQPDCAAAWLAAAEFVDGQAGHDIFLTSNNDFGLCPGSKEGGYAWHYRLVR